VRAIFYDKSALMVIVVINTTRSLKVKQQVESHDSVLAILLTHFLFLMPIWQGEKT
jgi:hypothetical protein